MKASGMLGADSLHRQNSWDLLTKKSLLIRALSTDPYWKEIGVSNFPSIIFQMDSAGSVNKQLTIMQLFVYIPN